MRSALLVLALLSASAALPARAGAGSITPEMDQEVQAGIDAIYSMDFDAAQADFERFKALAPGHPFGDFGLACVGWARYVYGSEMGDDALLKPFDQDVARTVADAKTWLAAHPRDPEALLALGAA
ncbi:MAG: hypothetical protein KGL53_06720, partial [Elusimicrobia bacterium]|nr:hypothetical protein [Elusimicrobiota bacterium]